MAPLADWRTRLADYIEGEAKPREKFGHQPRLYALTQAIGASGTYDDDIVYAAVWLHDLGVFTGHRPEDPEALARWDNTAYAIDCTPGLLKTFGFPPEKIAAVCECIRTHLPAFSPATLEATILRDADILEQLGAIGIARTLCKTGRDTRFATFTAAAQSLQTALDRLPQLITLPESRAMAEPRIKAHQRFLAALSDESDGRLF